MQPTHAFVNQKLVNIQDASLSISDLALLRGYGVFDFFRLINGQPFYFDAHWARLCRSADAMRLPLPFGWEECLDMIGGLVWLHKEYKHAGVRLTLTGGSSPDGYSLAATPNSILTIQPLPPMSESLVWPGIALKPIEYQRPLPYIKSIDYSMGILMQQQAIKEGFHDVVYHRQGWISEGPRNNFMAVNADGVLITPNADVLDGITRNRVLKHAKNLMPVEQRPVHIDELATANEAWVTSTTKGILPVSKVGVTSFRREQPGKVAEALYQLLRSEEHSACSLTILNSCVSMSLNYP